MLLYQRVNISSGKLLSHYLEAELSSDLQLPIGELRGKLRGICNISQPISLEKTLDIIYLDKLFLHPNHISPRLDLVIFGLVKPGLDIQVDFRCTVKFSSRYEKLFILFLKREKRGMSTANCPSRPHNIKSYKLKNMS